MIIIIDGPNRAGKTAYAERLAERTGFKVIPGTAQAELPTEQWKLPPELTGQDGVIQDGGVITQMAYAIGDKRLQAQEAGEAYRHWQRRVLERKNVLLVFLTIPPWEIKARGGRCSEPTRNAMEKMFNRCALAKIRIDSSIPIERGVSSVTAITSTWR